MCVVFTCLVSLIPFTHALFDLIDPQRWIVFLFSLVSSVRPTYPLSWKHESKYSRVFFHQALNSEVASVIRFNSFVLKASVDGTGKFPVEVWWKTYGASKKSTALLDLNLSHCHTFKSASTRLLVFWTFVYMQCFGHWLVILTWMPAVMFWAFRTETVFACICHKKVKWDLFFCSTGRFCPPRVCLRTPASQFHRCTSPTEASHLQPWAGHTWHQTQEHIQGSPPRVFSTVSTEQKQPQPDWGFWMWSLQVLPILVWDLPVASSHKHIHVSLSENKWMHIFVHSETDVSLVCGFLL